jgi:hypothetical protein
MTTSAASGPPPKRRITDPQISRVRPLRIAAWIVLALGLLWGADTLRGPGASWLNRIVEPTSGWGMVMVSVVALGHVLAAGVLAIMLVTLRERWAWWVGVALGLLAILDGTRFWFPAPELPARFIWAVQGFLGIALLVLLFMPASRSAFGQRSKSVITD